MNTAGCKNPTFLQWAVRQPVYELTHFSILFCNPRKNKAQAKFSYRMLKIEREKNSFLTFHNWIKYLSYPVAIIYSLTKGTV